MESGVERLKILSKAYTASRIFPEEITIADVAAQRGDAAMPGLVHDGAFGLAGTPVMSMTGIAEVSGCDRKLFRTAKPSNPRDSRRRP